jgi:hypothetical protein
MDDDDRSDPDRAAILARRQRFIALALSGLSASCGKNGGSPTPCLDVGPAETSSADDGATTGSSGMPMPCLDVDPTLDGTADDTGTDGGSDSSGSDSSGSDSSGSDDGTSSAG